MAANWRSSALGSPGHCNAWLVYPSRAQVPRKVRAFADYLKQEVRERPPWQR